MVAERLLTKLNLWPEVDELVVADDVGFGRPYPYMIHHLMRRFALLDARRVAKVGDTARDMLEGKNAGCGLVIGKHPHPLGTLHTTHTTCTAHQELWPGYRCAERC